jgi:hypothetical protein
MSVKPIWQTPAGALGEFMQGATIPVISLDVTNASAIELISKALPEGLKLNSSDQTITGVPIDLGITKTYEFVLRASNTTGANNSKIIQDRTFSITIISDVQPTLLTTQGTLRLGLTNENYILNNSTVNYQFNATASSIPVGQKLKFFIEEGRGELPPGLKISEDGLLYGTITDDLELDYRLVQGTYDKDYYDLHPYDYSSAIETAQGTTEVLGGKISAVELTYGGNGYILDPEVIIGGSVKTITINSGGSNYTTAPEIVFATSPIAGGITARGFAIISGGVVTGITITEPGTGYNVAPKIYFQSQNTGNGAVATCDLRSGSGAELVARVTNGNVVKIEVMNPGSGYGVTAPLISFGLPTAGSRIISKTYRFLLTVSNGDHFDTKEYVIIVKSEDSLRVDTTFILSDTNEVDTSRTYIQPPIWISPSALPIVKGDNQYIYDLEVFDPTPTIGKVYFSLMDVNFDGTPSEIGPLDTESNRVSYTITDVIISSPAVITLATSNVFEDRDRVKIENVLGTTELNNNIFYVKKISDTEYELYSDKILTTPINSTRYGRYISGGIIHLQRTFLSIDPEGGEINGFIPYQPAITKDYVFTVKVARVVDDVEVSNAFKQFLLTVKGNIQSEIIFSTPTLVGSLTPNEQSLLKIEASSTLTSASVNYQITPGYGRNSIESYVELTLREQNGNILIDGYGLNPNVILDKGQTYKINVVLTNFSVSLTNSDGTYYNDGIRHSLGSVGAGAQEKSSGYYIFTPPIDESNIITLTYSNLKRDGLFLGFKKYDENTAKWNKIDIASYFTEYDAYTNNSYLIDLDEPMYAIFLDYNKVQFEIKKYNTSTLQWDTQDMPTVKPTNPTVNNYWLDLSDSNFGILEFRYIGIGGGWVAVNPVVITSVPSNSTGVNGNYNMVKVGGVYKLYRKVNGVWKHIERLPKGIKTNNDPNVFINPYTKTPTTNIQYDVWFKYNTLFNGNHKEIKLQLKTLDNLPSELSITLNGEVVGKISPNTGDTYRSYFTANTLYLVNDVVTFDNQTYICIEQYRSSNNWYQDLDRWEFFTYTTRTTTSIDVNSYGIGQFTINSLAGDDGTTLDKLLRFRIRAKDTQNVNYAEKDFNISYEATSNTTLTSIFLQPFLNKSNRDKYFNFITDPNIFVEKSLYRLEDPNFGVQRVPKMLLLGGIESTTAERYASAVQRNYYDRPLYFGDLAVAIAKNNGVIEYEVLYVNIVDPSEVGGNHVPQSIKLDFVYDPLTVDYTKIRMDSNLNVVTDTGLDTIYPSSITLMQEELKKVTLEKTENILIAPSYDGPYIGEEPQGWGIIPTYQDTNNNVTVDFGDTWIDLDPVDSTEDWGQISERVAVIDDFLSVIQTLASDDKYIPLWMNTSQDGTGNPLGYIKAVPICYLKPGESAKILKLIEKSKFDFRTLNFTIDRLVIQNPQGETGDKYIKFINREII